MVGEKRHRECAGDLSDPGRQDEIFQIAGRVVGEGQDTAGSGCLKGMSGRVIVDEKKIRDSWRECVGRLVSEGSEWDRGVSARVGEVPADCIRVSEVASALKEMKGHEAPGLSGLVAEVMRAAEDVGTRWILDLCGAVVRRVVSQRTGGRVWCCQFTRGGESGGMSILQRNEVVGTCCGVVEGNFGYRVQQWIDIDDVQFGFMGGRGTTDVMFIVRLVACAEW